MTRKIKGEDYFLIRGESCRKGDKIWGRERIGYLQKREGSGEGGDTKSGRFRHEGA